MSQFEAKLNPVSHFEKLVDKQWSQISLLEQKVLDLKGKLKAKEAEGVQKIEQLKSQHAKQLDEVKNQHVQQFKSAKIMAKESTGKMELSLERMRQSQSQTLEKVYDLGDQFESQIKWIRSEI